jgi:hypothetical protein
MDFITDLLLCKEWENAEVHDNILVMINRYFKLAKYITTRKDLTVESLVIFIM